MFLALQSGVVNKQADTKSSVCAIDEAETPLTIAESRVTFGTSDCIIASLSGSQLRLVCNTLRIPYNVVIFSKQGYCSLDFLLM